jgi:hypothetical protein
VLNAAKLKHFFKNIETSEDKEEEDADHRFNQTQKFNQNIEEAPKDFSDIFNQAPHPQS